MSGRAAVAAALLLPVLGCAVNYLEPAAPFYQHRFAREAGAPAASKPFRVVSFNIEYSIRIDRAIQALRAGGALADADAVLLQEMDDPGVLRIAETLGMNAVYYPSGIHPKHRRDFGCAVLSPWPLEDPRKLVLPHGARVSGLRRAAVSATVARGDLRVRVYSVHLPSPLAVSGGARREQVRTLLADASAATRVVIGGDFNARGIGEELVAGGYRWLTRDVGPTVRTPLGSRTYDHVFVRGLASDSPPPSAGVADGLGASDHQPVWAVFVLASVALAERVEGQQAAVPAQLQ